MKKLKSPIRRVPPPPPKIDSYKNNKLKLADQSSWPIKFTPYKELPNYSTNINL